MRKLLLALALCCLGPSAWAQNAQCPTRPPGDSTNACASTAFVRAQVNTGLPLLATSQIYGGTGVAGVAQAFPLGTGVSSALQLGLNGTGAISATGSPAFTGAPTAPTQATSDTSTDIATDGFVNANLVVALPNLASTGLYGGTGAAGVAAAFTEAANTILGNATSGIAAPTALALGSCSTSASALLYTTNSGFSCNTAINAAQLAGATWASPPATGYGSSTPEPVAATNFGYTGTASGKAIKANGASNSGTAPTPPNSTTTYKMQGLAGSITPSSSGNVLIIISGTMAQGTAAAGDGILYQISYGTGGAPTSNGTLAGTQVGVVQEYTNPTTVTAVDINQPFSISWVVTGLTPGTAYWIDLAAKSVAVASSIGLTNVAVVAIEQ